MGAKPQNDEPKWTYIISLVATWKPICLFKIFLSNKEAVGLLLQIGMNGCKDIRWSTIFQQLLEEKLKGPKHSFCFWRACLGRLITVNRVGNYLQITDQNVCSLHRSNEESHHIFSFTAHIERTITQKLFQSREINKREERIASLMNWALMHYKATTFKRRVL